MNSLHRGLVGACLLASVQAMAADCPDFTLSPSLGLAHSQWKEHDATGLPLVSESGTLMLSQIEARLLCRSSEWRLAWSQAKGQRRYTGMTQRRQKALSTSDIKDQAWRLEALMPLDASWSGGLGLEYRSTDRNIRSTAQAQGYPERFQQWSALAGIRYQKPWGDNAAVSLSVWAGRILPGHMGIDLAMADPARLSLGGGHVGQLSLSWEGRLREAPGWSWSSSLSWHQRSTQAGSAHVLENKGRLVGTARQPQTTVRSLALQGTLQRAF